MSLYIKLNRIQSSSFGNVHSLIVGTIALNDYIFCHCWVCYTRNLPRTNLISHQSNTLIVLLLWNFKFHSTIAIRTIRKSSPYSLRWGRTILRLNFDTIANAICTVKAVVTTNLFYFLSRKTVCHCISIFCSPAMSLLVTILWVLHIVVC